MSTDIEAILRHNMQIEELMVQLERERDAALDTLKRARENWEHLADTAAANLAKVEHERDVLASEIEAANIALDLTDTRDCKLSLVERIKARQRNERRLENAVREALHELDTTHGLWATDKLNEYSHALTEGCDAASAWDCFLGVIWQLDFSKTITILAAALLAGATAEETLKRLPTIRDSIIHEAMMEAERAFSSEEGS